MDLLRSLESDREQAERRIKARFVMSKMGRAGLKKPVFGSMAYREYVHKGWITPEEEEADALMREIRALRTGQRKSAAERALGPMRRLDTHIQSRRGTVQQVPVRWGKEAPIPSDQYAPNMATTAARDDRLTPQAKALLVVLHARCAQSGQTDTTKGTLANIMGRSARSIQRYVAELVRFGYIEARTRRNGKGLYIGLLVVVSALVRPAYECLKKTALILAGEIQHGAPESLDFLDRTALSSKKRFKILYTADRPKVPALSSA